VIQTTKILPNEKPGVVLFLCYEKNTGGMASILLDFFKLCFMQSILTFSAVKLVPPLENGKS